MAKLEQTLTGNFDEILQRIEEGILNGSCIGIYGRFQRFLEWGSQVQCPGV